MAAERDVNLKIALEVEKHQCLFNFKTAEYSRKDVTEKAWSEVGKNTNLSMADCKEKWKNIRSAFVRSLKPAPSGSSAKTKKPYYLHDHLQFILPYVKPTNIIENPGNIEHPEEPPESPDPTENNDDTLQDVQAPSTEEQLPEPAPSTSSTTRRKRKKNDLDSKFLEYLETKKKNSAGDDDTAKRYFLLSLLPEIKNMNDKQMREFKIKVLHLIENILSVESSDQSRASLSGSSRTQYSSFMGSPTYNSNSGFSNTSYENSALLDTNYRYFALSNAPSQHPTPTNAILNPIQPNPIQPNPIQPNSIQQDSDRFADDIESIMTRL